MTQKIYSLNIAEVQTSWALYKGKRAFYRNVIFTKMTDINAQSRTFKTFCLD